MSQSTTGSSPDDVVTFFNTPRPTRAKRRAQGHRLRQDHPIDALAQVPAKKERKDPLDLLAAQEASRLPGLVELRHERMTTDPFAFLRGATTIMADDLSRTPTSEVNVQLCGDAHVGNFGLFVSPERDLVFDLHDYDETNPGPFEWDVKRLAASVVVAGQFNEHKPKKTRKAALAAASAYQRTIQRLSHMHTLDVWFATLRFDDLMSAVRGTALGDAIRRVSKKGGHPDSAAARLTKSSDDSRRFRKDPPTLVPVARSEREEVIADLAPIFANYLQTLGQDRLALLTRFSFQDIAHKIVGTGSVGTRSLLLLLVSGDSEPLILQIKQAQRSVLEPYTRTSRAATAGERVVWGQRMLQAAIDPFLGWSSIQHESGRLDFYVRQLRDVKASVEATGLSAADLNVYAQLCGAALARAHARGGGAPMIDGYLGGSQAFEAAIADFAVEYANLNLHDFHALESSMS